MQELYENLMTLCEDDSFFYVDQIMGSVTYRIFNYRLASYSQWLKEGALECRGITFSIDDEGNMIECVSRPFEKFFNLNENPMTMDLDLTTIVEVQEKMDGSLISSVKTEGDIWLKSKGSLFSEQAQAANRLIRTEKYKALYEYCVEIAKDGYTVIMEYVAPSNRIVVPYDEEALVVLAVRNVEDGEYFPLDLLCDIAPDHEQFCVKRVGFSDSVEFVDSISDKTGEEGFILLFESGQRVKVKTEWYLALHHLKDSINSQRRLFEACVMETSDDLRAQFHDDPTALKIITEMEEKVVSIYNHIVNQVEEFYKRNKHLERKDYAIKGQSELESMLFGLAMNLYLGKSVDYKEFMIKHRKDFGIKDDPEVQE